MLFIASQSLNERRVKIGDIVRQTGSPEAFTGKILGLLSRHGLVDSYTGPVGGFEIKKEKIRQITIEQIVRAIDGDEFLKVVPWDFPIVMRKSLSYAPLSSEDQEEHV